MSYIGNPVNSTQFTTDNFTGDGVSTSFTLSRVPASVTAIGVFVDGVKKIATGANYEYTLDGTTINFTGPPSNSADIEVVHYGIVLTYNSPADGSVTANTLATELRNVIATQNVANGSGQTFNLGASPISANAVIVTANGVVQYDYTVSGSTLILGFTPAAGTIVRAAGFGSVLSSGTPPDDSVSTAKLQNDAVTADKLADTTVSAGNYGGASSISTITVDAQGRITYAANVAIETGFNPFLLAGM